MGSYEMIDRLCGVTTMLADLVKEQASLLAQADIPDETLVALHEKQQKADDELNTLEYALRHNQ